MPNILDGFKNNFEWNSLLGRERKTLLQHKINQQIRLIIDLVNSLTERQTDPSTILSFLMFCKFVEKFADVFMQLGLTLVQG